ncbi:MAG: SGNH/GDSL hydrolase family protein [Candidatus Brocadiia bacterium]
MITWEQPWLTAGDKLICFGDSITEAPKGYVLILQELLARRKIEVINAGRGGDKTPWALTRLEASVIQPKPTAVSIFLGTNDACIGRRRWADEPTVSPEAYKCNLIWMIFLCRKAGIGKFSITPPLWRVEGEQWAEQGDILAPYCLAAREAADQAQARFVPADVAFAVEWQRHPGHTGLLLTTDGVHLTDQGNRIVAETMLEAWGVAGGTQTIPA